jgi:hypothetical protein
MKTKLTTLALLFAAITCIVNAQDTNTYQLRIEQSILDFPQQIDLPYAAPSMGQALDLSNNFYELGFWGIDKLGNKLFKSKTKPYTQKRKISNGIFKYGLGLAFAQYGSELPIPLGVWAHEEYHRSVLGVKNISSKNGNWLFSRWDGTVYGVSDQSLQQLKQNNINQLLYSYVSGVQYEIALNEKLTLNDFYHKRSLNKTALLLYNAYYMYNYFAFSTSTASDSVKVLAPEHESKNPMQRDFAGADLTAWTYDMFNPNASYLNRDSFPNGEGVNRRVGFSDLSPEAQDYLKQQKQLSLLNFLNPAIFFIPEIKLNPQFSFNFFTQYSPTHFGNDIALYVPIKYKGNNLLVNIHNYNNKTSNGYGIGLAFYHHKLGNKTESDVAINVWNQPKSFYNNKKEMGGAVHFKLRYQINPSFAATLATTAKTDGWMMSNPYLEQNISAQLGLAYQLKQ